jgi:hypothetical protein
MKSEQTPILEEVVSPKVAAIRTNPNQSISPPTMPVDPINLNGYNPIEAQLNIYQRQFTPMTNFSNNGSEG